MALLVLVALAACADEGLEADEIKLPSGRTVECVHDDGDRIRSLDCDWAGAR